MHPDIQAAVSTLAPSLRKRVEAAWDKKDYPSSISALEAALAEDPENVFAMIVLAATLFEDALDTVVDVAGSCRRALALLAKATDLGLPPGEVQDFEAVVRRVLAGESS